MEVVKDFDNKLLNRKDIVVKIENDSVTPSRKELRAQIAKQFKVDENLVIVKMVKTYYGSRNVDVFGNIYKDRKTLERLTNEHIVKRNTFEEPKAEAAEE